MVEFKLWRIDAEKLQFMTKSIRFFFWWSSTLCLHLTVIDGGGWGREIHIDVRKNEVRGENRGAC